MNAHPPLWFSRPSKNTGSATSTHVELVEVRSAPHLVWKFSEIGSRFTSLSTAEREKKKIGAGIFAELMAVKSSYDELFKAMVEEMLVLRGRLVEARATPRVEFSRPQELRVDENTIKRGKVDMDIVAVEMEKGEEKKRKRKKKKKKKMSGEKATLVVGAAPEVARGGARGMGVTVGYQGERGGV